MDTLVAVSLTLTLLYVLYTVLWRKNKNKNSAIEGSGRAPPCLPSLPLIGSLPFLSTAANLHTCLTEKAKRYGNLFAFNAAGRYTVVLNGLETIQDALVNHATDFAGRGEIYVDKNIFNVEQRGIIFKSYGDGFKRNRLHSMAVLKSFGFSDARTMETKIQAESDHLMKYIQAKNGAAFNPCDLFELATLNVIYEVMFSRRFEIGDPGEIFLRSTIKFFADSCNPLYDIFPAITYLPMYRKKLDVMRSTAVTWISFLENKIRESVASSEESDDNFVRQYIKRAQSEYDERELVFILRDLFVAGTETVSTQLCWAMILLCNHPDIKKKLQAEVDSVLPRGCQASMDVKERLPFLEATMLEVMRIRTIVPLSVPHATYRDTEVAGFSIPAETSVLVNLWSAHMDPGLWLEPDKFRPERFLSEDGKVVNRDKMITFSLGKRSCLGEVLGRQEMFLLLAGLVQNFDVLPPEGETRATDEMRFIRALSPAPFSVRLVAR